MPIPRFLEFAERYPSSLAALTGGLERGVQTGESLLGTYQQAKMAPIRRELAQAQAMRAVQQAAQPLGGLPLTGPAGQYNSYLQLRKTLPEGSPQQQALDKYWNIGVNKAGARAMYYGTNAAYRNLSPEAQEQMRLQLQRQTGKSIVDVNKMLSYQGGIYAQPGGVSPGFPTANTSGPNLGVNEDAVHMPLSKTAATMLAKAGIPPQIGASDVAQGKMPSLSPQTHENFTVNNPLHTPEQNADAANQIRQTQEILNKKVGDDTARKAIAPLMEVAKVINGIDIAPISKFTGFEGRTRYHYEQLRAGFGLSTTPDFKAAQAFHIQQAKLLADAIRQALKTSIRNEYVKNMLIPLSSVDVWKSDPETAIMRFNYMKDYLNGRLKTFVTLANKGTPLNEKEVNDMLDINVPKEKIPGKAIVPTKTFYSSKLGRNITEKDIQDTMKEYGLTHDQVISRYGVR